MPSLRRIAILILSIVMLLGAPISAKAENSIDVDYFYMGVCSSCDTERELLEEFHTVAKEAAPEVKFTVRMYNSMANAMSQILNDRCRESGVTGSHDEGIFIGDSFLPGRPDAEQLRAFIAEIVQSGAVMRTEPSALDAAQTANDNGLVRDTSTRPVLVYFYVTGCADCARVEEALAALTADYVAIHRFNVGQGENLALARQYFRTYAVPDEMQTTPILFYGDNYINANAMSEETISFAVTSGAAKGTWLPDESAFKPNDGGFTDTLEWGGVFLTGLLNGLNPCGLSMLLFLLTLVGTKGFLRNGALFIAGKVIAYFAIGTLGYHLFVSVGDLFMPGVITAVNLIMAAVALAVAFLHIRDSFLAKREKYGKMRMQIPEGLRRSFHSLIKRVAARPAYLGVGCLLLGALISAGEFLCTGQIYIASILYAVQNVGGARVYLFFAVYVIAAALPAVAILLLLRRGRAMFEVSEAIRAQMPRIRLAAGVFFLAFAAYFIVNAFR